MSINRSQNELFSFWKGGGGGVERADYEYLPDFCFDIFPLAHSYTYPKDSQVLESRHHRSHLSAGPSQVTSSAKSTSS